MASARAFTPSIMEASILDAPSMNGRALVINPDRSDPIFGNWLETPPIKPPAIPPKKEPMATPIFSSNLPPSPMSQLRPGIWAKAPMAANIRASSATTIPNPAAPAIAPGTSPATAPSATIMPESRPMPAAPRMSVFTSIPPSASATPRKSDENRFTPA